jgi:5-methylcytosine-specific restriction endonuclease McrA
VWISGEQDGMSLLLARLATEQALALKTQIDAAGFDRAHSLHAKAGLTMGEHRVEALAAMVLGGDNAATGEGSKPVKAHLNVTIPLPVLLGVQDGAAELAGDGAVAVEVVRELLADPDCAVTMRRLVTDPLTGHLLDYGRRTYEVPQRLRDYIIARDRVCRFPGCNRSAERSQIDHAIPYADGGDTTPANLGALCTRHHQLKTHCEYAGGCSKWGAHRSGAVQAGAGTCG